MNTFDKDILHAGILEPAREPKKIKYFWAMALTVGIFMAIPFIVILCWLVSTVKP